MLRFSTRSLAVALLALSSSLLAQKPQVQPTSRLHPTATPRLQVHLYETPALDRTAIAIQDAQNDQPGVPRRYAIPFAVDLTTQNSGTWDILGATSVWRLRIRCPNAEHINLGFSEFKLPADSYMLLYSMDESSMIRPFTGRDHQPDGQLWTPVVRGDDMIVELVVPTALRNKPQFRLAQIGSGYRFFGAPAYRQLGSGSCNVDVACPEGVGWEGEVSAVAAISTGGSAFCSGAMINNTSNDGRNFFLTAAHCGINAGNASSLVCYWNYENTSCGGGGASLSQFTTGSTFRAAYTPSDFTLVELTQTPNAAWDVGYAGWDRSGSDATSATAIHHPSGDAKKISFENQSTSTTSYGGTSSPGDGTHVRITDWDVGTTEGGSSGSPLFDQNHRIIGQLHGGGAACGNNLSDWYGKFAVSWNGGGTSSTRLSDWLDSAGSGFTTVDTNGGGGGPTGPSNDDCATATAVGEGVNGPFSSAGANTSAPSWSCASGGGDVWFAYTAPCTGTATFDTCSATRTFDTAIEAFGGSCGSLSLITCNDDACSLGSSLTINTTIGTTYLIRVGGYQGATGMFDLTVACTGDFGPPNDECAGAVAVTDGVNGPFSTTVSTTSTPAFSCATGGNDLWYSYVATCNGDVDADLCSATRDFDTVLAVYEGGCGALSQVACNDDSCSLGSAVSFSATVGTTYWFRVGGFQGATGSFDLTIACTSTGGTATEAAYGTGCYDRVRSFYEAPAVAAFDLISATLTLAPNPNGGYDVTTAAGSWVDPLSADLGLDDDGLSQHTLPFTLNYPGGSTNQITICSNGYIWLDGTSTGADWNPTTAEFTDEAPRLAPCWHDFDPTSGGSVHYDVIGGFVYVSWVDVPEFGELNTNSFQVMITPLGTIQYRYQTVSNGHGGATIVGFSSGNGALLPAESDLSAITTLSTSGPDAVPLTLTATTRPVLGTTQTMTISNIPATTVAGAVMYGLTQYPTGVELSIIGMPDCSLWSTSEFTIAFSGTPTATADWPIGNDIGLMGLHVFTTAAVIAPGQNALGVITSNGIDLGLDVF
ncbi:MAG: trypsin-like peptidase domain-containing protein [Planctomycetes bacterium]|nr:trypsin-like peptidase domain-containing protein [Planctomycetota bacterium]